jgi:hypothetical protein
VGRISSVGSSPSTGGADETSRLPRGHKGRISPNSREEKSATDFEIGGRIEVNFTLISCFSAMSMAVLSRPVMRSVSLI